MAIPVLPAIKIGKKLADKFGLSKKLMNKLNSTKRGKALLQKIKGYKPQALGREDGIDTAKVVLQNRVKTAKKTLIGGAGAGAGAVGVLKNVDNKNKKPNPKAKGTNVGSKQNISSATGKSKGVASSFDEAFKAARRSKGAGSTFTYKGKSYTTDTKADLDKKKKDTITKNMAKAATRSGARVKNMYGGGKVKKMMGGGYMKKMSYGGKVKKMMGGGKVKKRYV